MPSHAPFAVSVAVAPFAAAVEKVHAQGKMTARERVLALLDEGSFAEFDRFSRHRSQAFGMADKRPYTDGVVTGVGAIVLTDLQKENLKKYVADGGLLLADPAGGNKHFAESFSKLAGDLFSPLVPATPDFLADATNSAKFDVHLKKVEEKKLPELDDEFCREYGVLEGGIEQLRKEVRENMERELEQNVRARLKAQLMEGLLAANPVEVPQSLVDAQVREMQIDAARRMGARDASQVPPPEPFVEGARKRVALGLLIGELIKTRGLKIDRERVESRLADLAASYPDPEQVIKAYRQNADALRQIENIVIEDQVVDLLLEHAKVTDQPATFKDVMNFGA